MPSATQFLSRMFGLEADPKLALKPLWHSTVSIAREPEWFADCGVPDTIEGRYDMITAVLSVVLLRMEREQQLMTPSVHLTELFVDDMDGQLREQGIGDPALGKHMGKIVSAMGGRLGAFRDAFAADQTVLETAIARNIGLNDGTSPALLAQRLTGLAQQLDGISAAEMLAGEITR